jgi:hypothetical protein
MFQMIVPTLQLCGDFEGPIASKLAPTGECIPVWEPAGESGLSGDEDYAPGMKCFCAVPRAIRREM